MAIIPFLSKRNRIKGESVDLVERYSLKKEEASDGVATVFYSICLHDSTHRVGYIDLRLTADGPDYYYGHIGYRINEEERGHHYAYEACKVLFKEAYEGYNLKELIITCSPDNVASYKTLEKLGGELIETVEVPVTHELYRRGEKIKAIFRYDLEKLWKD